MQFIVTGYDGTDEKASERRFSVRGEHLKLAESMKNQGKFLCAGALLDDNENMIGSVMIVEFESRKELDEWLEIEPYVTGDVWQTIEIKPFRVPTLFLA